MKYYNLTADSLIDGEELIAKYGSLQAIPELGIFNLSIQPDYVPVGFHKIDSRTFYPIESYVTVKLNAAKALEEAGYTADQIAEILDI
jgi:hypothetical protein